MYGRDEELSVLHEVYKKVRAGDGQVVLIAGEAGIGKSRLVDELIAQLQNDGEDINFLFGSYPPNGAATATGAFASGPYTPATARCRCAARTSLRAARTAREGERCRASWRRKC